MKNLERQEIREILENCLNQLKPLHSATVKLYYLNDEEELNYKEVGNRLGITGTYVGKILCETLPKMKECLEAQGYSLSDLLQK